MPMPRTRRRGAQNKRKSPAKKVAKLSKPLRRAVKAIVRGEAETKRTNWYQDYNDGTVTTKATGFYSTSGWAVQSNRITLNNTDILRLIPTVLQGTDDFNRIGTRIRPVSLNVKGQIRVRFGLLNAAPATIPQNLTIDLYVLQHVRLKDYNSLYGLNNFTELLETGEGGTQAYSGVPINSAMRVASETYKVLHRRRITLRYAGVVNATVPDQVPFAQPQDHTWYSEYSLNLTKHLPKVLTYPEGNSGAGPSPPVVVNAPTNSSIFMCMGYASWYSSPTFVGDEEAAIEQTYVSEMGFKDI